MIFEVQSLFISVQHLFVLMPVYVVSHCQFIRIFMPRFYAFEAFWKSFDLMRCFYDPISELQYIIIYELGLSYSTVNLLCKFY